jgi:hypothetical protein
MLHFEIDGHWEPEDFIEVLKGIESLYYKAALSRLRFPFDPFYWFERGPKPFLSFEENLDVSNDWLLASARITATKHQRLSVARIEYGSPGAIDLVGFGEACKAVEGIIDHLLKFFTERNLRRERDKQAKLDTELKEVEVEKERESLRALKLENARTILAIRDDFPHAPDNFLLTLTVRDQDKLIPRIAEGKLVGVSRDDRD